MPDRKENEVHGHQLVGMVHIEGIVQGFVSLIFCDK